MNRLISASKRSMFPLRLIILCGFILPAARVSAQVCLVPSPAYPSVQAAVDDAGCAEIVLAAQELIGSVSISRSLALRGDSSATSTVKGRVTVTGAATDVILGDLTVDGEGCFPVALDIRDGAQITSGHDVVVANTDGGECPIFSDGFERGSTAAWSSTVG